MSDDLEALRREVEEQQRQLAAMLAQAPAVSARDRVQAVLDRGEAGRSPDAVARQQLIDEAVSDAIGLTDAPTERERMAAAYQPGRLGALFQGAVQGASFGAADEIVGGMSALGAAFNPNMTMGQGYEIGRDRARGMFDAAQRDFPGTTTIGEMGGGGMTSLAYGLPAMAGRGLMGATMAGAGLGAAEGLAYGAMSGEGGVQERLQGALPAAAIGAGAGALAPSALAGLEYVSRPVRGAVGNIVDRLLDTGSERRANRALRETMGRARMTPADVSARLSAAAAEGQPEFRLMDALGDPGARRASGIVRAGEEGAEEIRAFLAQRQADQGDRIGAFLGDAFDGGQTARQGEAALADARRVQARAQYGAAEAAAQPVDVRGALQIVDDRIGGMAGSGVTGDSADAALARFRNRLAAPDRALPEGASAVELSDFRRVLGVKQDAQDAAEAARRAGRNNEANALTDFWRALDSALEAASPDYRAANDAYREASRVIGAIETGQEAARPMTRAADVVDTVSRMTPEQQDAARLGFGDRALARVEATAGPGTNRARPLSTSRFQEISRALARDPDLLMSRLARENQMFEAQARALGGSRTADNLADIAGVQPFDASTLANIATGRWGAAASQIAGAASDLFSGMSPQTRRLIAQALISNDASVLEVAVRQGQITQAQRNIAETLMRVGAMQQADIVE